MGIREVWKCFKYRGARRAGVTILAVVFAGGLAGWCVFALQLISYMGDLEVEFSDYWICSRKVEEVTGIEEYYAIFDTITLPLTFYNSGKRERVVRMLRLEVWDDDSVVDTYQANREYQRFGEPAIEEWNVENFYMNSVVPGHTYVVKTVEFYPVYWVERSDFVLQPHTKYRVKLFMKRTVGAEEENGWDFMGEVPIRTWGVDALNVDPDKSEDQVDAIVY